MLEMLRKDASKFFSKILLGFIALVFVLYFGFNFSRRGRGGNLENAAGVPIASVNGTNIPTGKFNQDVQNQMSIFQQFNQGQVSADTEKMVQNQILQRLIYNELFSQTAYRLGLRVTDVELAKEIMANQAFQKDGQFNENFYLHQFKPYYESNYGQDYEYSLRDELLSDKLKDAINQAAIVSQQQIQDEQLLQQTKLNIQKLDITIKTLEGEKQQEKAIELAKTWISDKKAHKSNPDLLKNPSLKETELGLKSLYELQMILGKEDSLPILFCLMDIKPGEICEEPYRMGDHLVAVALKERQNTPAKDENEPDLTEQLSKAKKNQFLTSAADLLIQKAKIDTFLQKK